MHYLFDKILLFAKSGCYTQHHVLSHTCRRLPIIILMPEEEGRQKKKERVKKKRKERLGVELP
jgi:hypothetical protein